ncbi:MAG: hypothetical protein GY753_10015, partial [Gammaproteobacteria bacterium]|nr:hypothetical protein [Gammaproteobacteria bacterium]
YYFIVKTTTLAHTNNQNDVTSVASDEVLVLTADPTDPTLCTAQTEIPQAECEELVALYDATDGFNWKNNSGWKQTNTPCSWYGVSCSGGYVSGLNLDNNQLSGSIPDFANLPKLQYLYLESNQLSGEIPDFLDTLTKGDFGYNALTADPFGDGARLHPDWADTQTIPPSGVSAAEVSPGSVEVTWTPVSYVADPGYYQVSYSNTSGASYTDVPIVGDKSASSITVSDLTQGANYYFIVKTTTLAHTNNQNDVTSVASDEVLVLTADPTDPTLCTAQTEIP